MIWVSRPSARSFVRLFLTNVSYRKYKHVNIVLSILNLSNLQDFFLNLKQIIEKKIPKPTYINMTLSIFSIIPLKHFIVPDR